MLSGAKESFVLNRGMINLDHGGYGTCPKEVLAAAEKLRRQIEAFPPRAFFDGEGSDCYAPSLRKTAALVATRFGADADDMALITNATEGINGVLRSLSFSEGDEILISSLAYGAILYAAEQIAEEKRALVKKFDLPFPNPDTEPCLNALKTALTSQTKLVILDHITSGTALLLPIHAMIELCHQQNIPVLVDGAHAPGNVALDIPNLGADWYVGNLHKWYFAPRPCAFLWARKDRQNHLKPAIHSWGAKDPFPQSFHKRATHDPALLLSIPDAFAFMDRFGEAAVRTHNHTLVYAAAQKIAQAWGVPRSAPKEMTTAMCLVTLPDHLSQNATPEKRKKVQTFLAESYKIACPCILHEDKLYMRLAANIHNKEEDYEQLAHAIMDKKLSRLLAHDL